MLSFVGPLDVAGEAVVILDAENDLGELERLLVGEGWFIALYLRQFTPLVATTLCSPECHPLERDVFIYDTSRRFLNHARIGGHLARYDCFAKAKAGFDNEMVAVLGHWMHRERDARHFALHHLLHHDRNR